MMFLNNLNMMLCPFFFGFRFFLINFLNIVMKMVLPTHRMCGVQASEKRFEWMAMGCWCVRVGGGGGES